MKATEEYIDEIEVNESNLNHIAEIGRINGSLLISIRKVITKAQKEAYNQALKDLSDKCEWYRIATHQSVRTVAEELVKLTHP